MSFDPILLDFVQGNAITIGLVFAILKVIAKNTPWAVDDEIVQILTGFFSHNGKA